MLTEKNTGRYARGSNPNRLDVLRFYAGFNLKRIKNDIENIKTKRSRNLSLVLEYPVHLGNTSNYTSIQQTVHVLRTRM
jgi:hypothetical protein